MPIINYYVTVCYSFLHLLLVPVLFQNASNKYIFFLNNKTSQNLNIRSMHFIHVLDVVYRVRTRQRQESYFTIIAVTSTGLSLLYCVYFQLVYCII